MPLARIFTCYPQQTSALSEQLQQQGYNVEVLSPDQAPDTLADLEIQLEVCDPADVLRRATELAARLHADIAVAPGALLAEPSPVQAPAAPPFAQEEQIPRAAVPLVPAPAEPVAGHPATMETQQPVPTPQASETETPAASPSFAPETARSLGAILAACAVTVERFLVAVRCQFRESKELARVQLAQAQVLREQRLLDLARRRAEVREQVLELRAGRHVLDAYLMHLRQEAPARTLHDHPAPAQDAASVRETSLGGWRTAIKSIHLGRREAIIGGLVAVVALLAVGLTVGEFYSRPAPAKTDGLAPQPGGVTLQASQPISPTPTRPSPGVRKTTPNVPAQGRKSTPKATAQAHKTAPKPSAHARHARAKAPQQNASLQKNREVVGTDVVVRHFPAPKPTPHTQADGWKHFSDMSN